MRGACVLAQADRPGVRTEHRAGMGVMRGEAHAGEGPGLAVRVLAFSDPVTPVRYTPWSAGMGVPGLALIEGSSGWQCQTS